MNHLSAKRKAVFIDKDGTLIPDIPYNVNPDLIAIGESTTEGLRLLKTLDFLLILITNQSGIAKGYFEEEALEAVWQKLQTLLGPHGLALDAFYFCPHHPEASVAQYKLDCDCRKPLPGLILKAGGDWNVNLNHSWMIGDILNDVEAGHRAGCSSVLLDNGGETEWLLSPLRTPDYTCSNLLEAARFIQAVEKEKAHGELERL